MFVICSLPVCLCCLFLSSMGPAAYNKSYEDDDDLPLFISGYDILLLTLYKSSAVAEMGDHGHNRHGPNRGGAAVPLSRASLVPV